MMIWIATGVLAIVLVRHIGTFVWCLAVAIHNARDYMRAVDELDASMRRHNQRSDGEEPTA